MGREYITERSEWDRMQRVIVTPMHDNNDDDNNRGSE